MQAEAMVKSPLMAYMIDKQPNNKFNEVMAFGICCFNVFVRLSLSVQNNSYFGIQKIRFKIFHKSLFLIDMRISFKVALPLISALLLMSFSLQQSSGVVKLMNHQKKSVPFKVSKTHIEWVNGFINLAFTSTDGRMIQVNQIWEKALKDTSFRSSQVKLILMDGDQPFKSVPSQRNLIEITCKKGKKGEPITINAQGKVYRNKAWYNLNVTFKGKLPEHREVSTQKMTN